MAEHTDGGNKSPEQIEAEELDCWRKSRDGHSYREIAEMTGLSKSVVARRINESILGQEMPSREARRHLEGERLDYYTRALHKDLARDCNDPVKVVHAAVAISKARRQLWGLDEPKRVEVNNTTPSDFEGRKPAWMTDDLEKFKQSDLYRADLQQAGRDPDTEQ